MSVDRKEYDKFEWAEAKYLPTRGEGETMATQIVTAVTKLVYKWYNDGDVFDNRYALSGWCNDLSSYANWLVKYSQKASCLYKIEHITNEGEYEDLLLELTKATHDPKYLAEMDRIPRTITSIYECDGPFEFVEYSEDDDDEEDW